MKTKNIKRAFFLIPVFLTIFLITMFQACQKTNAPLGVIAPLGLDFPTRTPTPGTGAFNLYVYDGQGKQGVTVLLVDPTGTTETPIATTDQFGNAIYNPYPLLLGTYKAIVPAQGKYGLSILPVTISSGGQGAVSVTFATGNEALSIVSGAPASFTSSGAAFPYVLNYIQPGTLNVPVSVRTNNLGSNFSSSPATFVMGAAVSTMGVTINKSGCQSANEPVTWTATDFLSLTNLTGTTTLYRNFPVNVQLDEEESDNTCNYGAYGTWGWTLTSPSDCNTTWILSFSGSSQGLSSFSVPISNGQTVNINGSCIPIPSSFNAVQVHLSSVLGNAIGSGYGIIINTTF